jgi:hypothetical protein
MFIEFCRVRRCSCLETKPIIFAPCKTICELAAVSNRDQQHRMTEAMFITEVSPASRGASTAMQALKASVNDTELNCMSACNEETVSADTSSVRFKHHARNRTCAEDACARMTWSESTLPLHFSVHARSPLAYAASDVPKSTSHIHAWRSHPHHASQRFPCFALRTICRRSTVRRTRLVHASPSLRR